MTGIYIGRDTVRTLLCALVMGLLQGPHTEVNVDGPGGQ